MRDIAIGGPGVEVDGLAYRVLCGLTRAVAMILLSPALLAVAVVTGLGMLAGLMARAAVPGRAARAPNRRRELAAH